MVSHCLVIGDKKRFLTMIVTLKCKVTRNESGGVVAITLITLVIVFCCSQFDQDGLPTSELSEIALEECAKIDSNSKTGELRLIN